MNHHILLLILLCAFVENRAAVHCPVGRFGRSMDTNKTIINNIVNQNCKDSNTADLCAYCCSYSYRINTTKLGNQQQRCVAWASTTIEGCTLETPASTDFEMMTYACNPEQETCAACNDDTEGLQKVNAAALLKSTRQQKTAVLLSLSVLLWL